MERVSAYRSTLMKSQDTRLQPMGCTRRIRCDPINMDARNIVWLAAGVLCLFGLFYAYDLQFKMKRFEDEVKTAHLAMQRYSNMAAIRSKRDVDQQLYLPAPNGSDPLNGNGGFSISSGGITYIRWGRHDCSKKTLTHTVYGGFGAGSHYSHAGGGSNYLCLHKNVTYTVGKFVENSQGSSYIYGLEYRDAAWVHALFNLSDTERDALQFSSVPCAMCLSEGRLQQIMIPGRDTCPNGWMEEYKGYIMGGSHGDTHASKFICVDERPQVVPGTHANEQGSFLLMAETQCASLLCEPYVANRELRCIVCSM